MKSHVLISGLASLAILCGGCSGLSELPMYWGNNAASPDIKPTGYHAESKTGWMSYNDSTHIYFAFTFFEPRIQTQILRSGMTVFIDTTGKMKEGCFVRFPMIKRDIISGAQADQKLQPRQGAQGRGQRTTTEMLLDQAQGFELQWQKGKEVIQVNPAIEKTDFKTSVGLDSAQALNMVIGVPLNMILPGGLKSMDQMVVGLRFGQAPAGNQMGGGQRPQMSGGSQQPVLSGSNAGVGGGGSGGGRGRRGGGGGGGGGNAGGGSMGAERMNSGGGPQGMDNSPMEFWYKTKLIKR
jgi:hypothetical protein